MQKMCISSSRKSFLYNNYTIKMESQKPLAIIIGRNYTTRLSLIQSIGEAGCDIVVIQTGRTQKSIEKIDASSKYVVEARLSREPNSEELLEIVNSYKDSNRKTLLVPADDYAASVIDKNLNLLQKHFFCPNVHNTQGGILKLMDKVFQKSLAHKVGLHVSKYWIANQVNGSYALPTGVIYPCFTKPLESYSHGPLKKYQRKCETEKELKALLKSIGEKYQIPVLIEQYHEISKEYAVVGLSLGNKSIIPSVIQMITSKDGLTAAGVIFPISRISGLQQQLSELMSETQLTGLFDIDLYESGGELFFNELNVRYGASGFVLNKVIGNLPGIYVNYLLGMDVDTSNQTFLFNEKSFASEKVLEDMYLNNYISFKEYRKQLENADILSLNAPNDLEPYSVFRKRERFLGVKRCYLNLKSVAKFILHKR